MLWPVVIVYPRGRTQGCQWRGLVCLWVKRTDTGEHDLDSSSPKVIGNQLLRWGGALGDQVCVSSALSTGVCIGNVVVGGPGEEPERKRGGAIWNFSCKFYGE